MRKQSPEIGSKFNRLTILKEAPMRDNRTCIICKCDCGTIKSYFYYSVKQGHSKSCGCYKEDILRLDEGKAAFYLYIENTKRGLRKEI